MPDIGILIITSLIVALAFLVKSTTGFGENLVMIPLLSLMLDLKVVLPLTLTIVLVADAYLLYSFHRDIHWQAFWRFLVPAIPGVLIGAWGLQSIQSDLLEPVLGILIMLYAFTVLIGPVSNSSGKPSPFLNYTAGLLGGGLSGLLGIGGPPVIAYLNHLNIPKHVFRATCVMTFLSFDLFRLGTYSWQGYFTWDIFLYGLSLIPVFVAGSFLGMKLHNSLNETWFQKMVAVLLFWVGVALLF